MVEINLLPWRVQKQAYERERLRYFLALSVVAAWLMVMGLHGYWQIQINRQAQQVASLRAALPKDSQSVWPTPPMTVTHHLLQPTAILEFLQALSASAQHGICYQRMTRDDSHVSLSGQGKSLMSVNAGLQALEAVALFPTINLREIKQSSLSEPPQFIFDARGV
jgi:Tfp pilus assembly protein PilN